MLKLPKMFRLSRSPQLGSVIDTYLQACQVEGKTVRTIGAYRESLGQFSSICEAKNLPTDVSKFRAKHVYAFLAGVQDRGVSLGTQHRRFRETRAFFSWCARMDFVDENPFTGIPNVKPGIKIITPFTSEEISRLLAACDQGTEFGVRNRAIILLFLDTGLRRSELEQLDVGDVDLELRRIQVLHGKGRKQRIVSFSSAPAEAISRYLDAYRGRHSGRLFLTVDRGAGRNPLNKYHLGTLFRRLGDEAGVHANPHRFRHTFATWSIEAGAREIDVQYLLGHSSTLMVRRYSATYDAEKAANNHSSFSPAASL